ncbi:hypothetical protein GTW20_13385 [Nocardiopsis alba]|uniref:3'-5' exonuclease domain-containing protein n=1 Tax=Nocardiopsis alba TaxID=53437 RepID=A0A7K2ITC6_9ACTN|nr:hypothetical protein [Nocardiopsis alba]MYR33230.1 hypothetical protein [Nocardiopsis alba]
MPTTLVHGDLTAELADTIRREGRVAVDTETSGLEWETEKLQLCQFFTPTTGPVLVNRLSEWPEEILELLQDPNLLKIMHFAPFDLRFLEATWGVVSRSVACTKAASRILEPEQPAKEHSLQNLLFRRLGVSISKGPVRTGDWSVETLTAEQLAYAAADVEHLIDLYESLVGELHDRNLEEMYGQVCLYLPVDAHLAVSRIPDPLRY